LEAEDREIQQAKLQELIRKGTPRDLAEANHLMKILSGYDERHKPDYRAKAAEEVEQLRRKADLLREMLLGVQRGETIGQSDAFEVFQLTS
jgi:ADP-ribosylation factor-binding protein GGA